MKSLNTGIKVCQKEITLGLNTLFESLATDTQNFSQSLLNKGSEKSEIIEEYVIPSNGISLDQVTKDTIENYGNYLQHTFKYSLRGLGDKVNIDEACVLGDIWEKHYASPAFSWDCSAAHADSMVVLSEKLRRLYEIPDKFSYGNSGVGIVTISQNDSFFLCLNDAIQKRLKAIAKETSSEKDVRNSRKFSVYGISNEYFIKPLKMKDIHNFSYEAFQDSKNSVALD